MCGIVGIAGFEDRELVTEMTSRLVHRGPDAEGFFLDPEASFGHRRLSVLDIEGGVQPMASATGRTLVAFNGQIYNHDILKRETLPDYPFATRSDTEVLPALYEKFGAEMVHHLRGMFAFAIWDRDEKQLFLARDRIGIKPLYYAQLGSRLLFASEPKALLACPEVSREIDPVALDAYLRFLYVPPPLSIFSGIRQLPPGCRLTWKDGEFEIDRYWDVDPTPNTAPTNEELAEEIAPLLEDSIKTRAYADVPLGAFLSGGIDSSTLVAVLAEHSAKPVETFCVGFGDEGKAYEERPLAREVSEHFGTNHHEMEMSFNLVDNLEEMVRGFDEPFGNPTALLTLELSKFTRQHVTVSLAGDGGDEVFCGYPRYQGMLWSERLRSLPGPLRSRMARGFGGRESTTARNWRRWGRQLLEGCELPPGPRYESWVGYADADDVDRVLASEWKNLVQGSERRNFVREYFEEPERADPVRRAVYADLRGFLPENVLRYSDRMSMAASLEVRVPFTDHRLVEAALRAPSARHVGYLATKRVLRKIMKGRLPEKVLDRKKLGFNPPMGIWLRGEDNPLLSKWLSPDRVRAGGMFEPAEVSRLLSEHQSGKREHGLRLWSMIVFEVWRKMYLDQ